VKLPNGQHGSNVTNHAEGDLHPEQEELKLIPLLEELNVQTPNKKELATLNHAQLTVLSVLGDCGPPVRFHVVVVREVEQELFPFNHNTAELPVQILLKQVSVIPKNVQLIVS